MSLTILPPAPSTYTQQAFPPVGPSPSKRPKLTLNTSSVNPIYGKGSTSLRLETLSATSPTARNTFRNTQSPKATTRPRRPALRPLTTNPETPATPSLTPSRIELPDSANTTPGDLPSSSTTSATSVSTLDSLSTSEPPYKLSFNTKSILVNGPLERRDGKRRSFSQSKPLFPTPKKVNFRANLEEAIVNTEYTLRHSDIVSVPSEGSTLELSPPKKGARKDASNYQQEGANLIAENITSPLAGSKREANEEDESDSVPATPVAGRRKKDRAWRWTLGPISSSEQEDEENVETP